MKKILFFTGLLLLFAAAPLVLDERITSYGKVLPVKDYSTLALSNPEDSGLAVDLPARTMWKGDRLKKRSWTVIFPEPVSLTGIVVDTSNFWKERIEGLRIWIKEPGASNQVMQKHSKEKKFTSFLICKWEQPRKTERLILVPSRTREDRAKSPWALRNVRFLVEDDLPLDPDVYKSSLAEGIAPFVAFLLWILFLRRKKGPTPPLALLLLVTLAGCGDGDRTPAGMKSLAGSLEGRSVVIIVADALHAEHLSCFGCPRRTSPRLDQLPGKGVLFEKAYAQTSWTLPSVASLFTGLQQERHGVLYRRDQLNKKITTLAELFQRKGYRTLGLVQNAAVGPHTKLDRGFDEYRSITMERRGTTKLMALAKQRLLSAKKKPLFAYIHLRPPHEPYQPPPRFQHQYNPDYEGPVDGTIESFLHLLKEPPEPEHPDAVQLAALYDEQINWVDFEIGGLLDFLAQKEVLERFLFVITSDHGEAFFQHGAQGHCSQVYEEMVHVPLILHAPGSPLLEGQVIPEPVTLMDLLPTLTELCALSGPGHAMDGSSLVHLMEGSTPSRQRPLFFTSRYLTEFDASLQSGVRVGSYKLVRENGSGEILLFDLDADPGETLDIKEEKPAEAARLEELLRHWTDQVTRERARRGKSNQAILSPEVREELDALGYAGD